VASTPGIFSDGYFVDRNAALNTEVADLREVLGSVTPTYSITSGNGSGIFAIDAATGKITVANAAALAADTNASYTLGISAALSSGGAALTLTATIATALSGGDGETLSFIAGDNTENQLKIRLPQVSAANLLGFVPPSVASQSNAESSVTLLKAAIMRVTELRAEIGSKQASADILTIANENALLQQVNGRAAVADTDIAAASTALANNTVQTQMSINMAAQGNNLNRQTVLGIINRGQGIQA
jgi:flagellin-like hook-associated protein FlgL